MNAFSPIGLDWSGPTAAAVQLRRGRNGWRLHAALRAPVGPPTDADVIAGLHRVLWRHGFEGTDVALTLPTKGPAGTFSSAFALPPRSSGAPVEQLSRVEMARVAARAPEELELEMWEVPAPRRAAGGWHVMAIAAVSAEIAKLVDVFDQAGLRVLIADARATALARAAGPLLAAGDELTLVLDVSWDSAHLIACGAGTLVFDRRIDELALGTLAAGTLGIRDERLLSTRLAHRDAPSPSERRSAGDQDAGTRRFLESLRAAIGDEIGMSASYLTHQFDRRIARAVLCAPAFLLPELNAPGAIETIKVGDWSVLKIGMEKAPADAESLGAVIAALGSAWHPDATLRSAAA